MPVELTIPKVGESIVEVEIGEWLKKEGDQVAEDETVAMLDSEKTTVELRSPAAGVLCKILKQQGETAAIGEVVGHVEEGATASPNGVSQQATPSESAASGAEATPAHAIGQQPGEPKAEWDKSGKDNAPTTGSKAEPPKPVEKVEAENLQAEKEAQPVGKAPLVMPAARHALAEHGLRAEDVESSGPGGRLLKEDVLRHVEQIKQQPVEAKTAPTSQPEAAPANKAAAPQQGAQATDQAAGEEIVPMSPLRRRVAKRLVEAQQTAALLTTFNEVDMSAVMALRKEHQEAFQKRYNIKLGFMSFFVKAAIDALKKTPGVNAEIRDNNIVYRNYYDIGVAIGSGKGLVVPIIRHAERLSFAEIEMAIADFGKRARDSKLIPDELIGGTFTISNGGVYGSLLSTPIVNPPQSGILGMHAIQERPVALDGQVVIRPMMYIALTYDHRVVDGREAVTFLVRIKECIENPTRMLIEI